jgi:toxin FitB
MFLLDTNVISEPKQKMPNPNVLAWLSARTVDSSFLSVITLGEIEQGIVTLGDTKRARRYREWLENELKVIYRGRMLNVDEQVMSTWGRITGEALNQGRPASFFDSLLAATAITHQLTLVTRNVKDVSMFNVNTLNLGSNFYASGKLHCLLIASSI